MKYFTIPAIIIAIAALTTGCAQFQNRLTCTLDGKESMVVSKYMKIGISSDIAKSDIPAECKKLGN